MKTGLVLEGGAMRGIFTTGVLDVFMENDIEADGVVGVSAGACFGCNYISHQIGRAVRYNLRFCKDWHYGTFRSFFLSGNVYDPVFCYEAIPDKLDPFDAETFSANPVPFYVVCTDLETGQPVYHELKNGDKKDLTWMRASASMPFFSRPVSVDGYLLLDGGIGDSIPVEWFRSIGYEKNIVILTRQAGYRKGKPRFTGLERAVMSRYPEMAEAMINRNDNYNRTLDLIEKLEKSGELFVIRPEKDPGVKHMEHDPDKLSSLYLTGRSAGERSLDDLRKFIAKG